MYGGSFAEVGMPAMLEIEEMVQLSGMYMLQFCKAQQLLGIYTEKISMALAQG